MLTASLAQQNRDDHFLDGRRRSELGQLQIQHQLAAEVCLLELLQLPEIKIVRLTEQQ
jgi:hypothetical protein